MLDTAPAVREELGQSSVTERTARIAGAHTRRRVADYHGTDACAGVCAGESRQLCPRTWHSLTSSSASATPSRVRCLLEPGSPEPRETAPGADIRTDLPRYRIYENGSLVDEVTADHDRWQDDFVSKVGCSFSF